MLIAMVFWLFLPLSIEASAAVPLEGFSVEPAILRISVERGGQFKSFFTLKNTGEESIALDVLVADFVPVDGAGGVREMEGVPDKDDPVRASGWFSLPDGPLIVPAHKSLRVPFSISVPSDANPGGRSVVFELESSSGSARERLNMLNFLTVPGETKEQLTILSFTREALISAGAQGTFSLELKNDGDTHLRPEGSVVIRNMFGVERGRYVLDNTLAPGTIIPGSKRNVEYDWKGSLGIFDFGLWNAHVELNYGENNAHLVADRTFFLVLPWRAIVLMIIILGGAIKFFAYAVRKLRDDLEKVGGEFDGQVALRVMSARLLIIPFIAGLLLLIVTVGTLISVLSSSHDGSFVRIQKISR